MKILVVNCGSSSLKYQLIDMENEKLLAKGNFERIGEKESFVTHKVNGEKYVVKEPVKDHEEALKIVLQQLVHKDYGVIKDLSEINAVGHRLVHGGEIFNQSVLITEDVIKKYESCSSLAPLHNPATILGIRACQKEMPGVPMCGVFDTAFHQTMPKENYLYPIPYEYYEKYGIRKYGFHGTSHQFVSKRAAEIIPGNIYSLLEKTSDRLVSKPANGFSIADDDDDINLSLEFIKTNIPNAYKIKDTKTGKFLESLFGTLRLNPEKKDDAQCWVFNLQEDGYYQIQNLKDKKYVTVSGSNTFAGSNLYLTELSKKLMQDFAVYFDSNKYKYKEADIFSATYKANNLKQMEAQ